jgi:hypothetical protein
MALIVCARASERAERVDRRPKVWVPKIDSGIDDGDANAVAVRKARRCADTRDTCRYNLSDRATAATGFAARFRIPSDILICRHHPIGNDGHY